ncbi:hypothetical protein IE53DRAFT_160190 [Violaceomyces palustris]|uniref:Uncharacterized protein n=1 Tax=Violaceomyces palustris TaxID=1673888 RepID=A0ACD0NTQ6_9BASI|nr:hypothetical protein IE53DRAFT_160190 [Violaceomyces palustris]
MSAATASSSTPASTVPATTTSTTGNGTPSATTKPAVQPSEVGWLFVPQYYTFLNQNPGRLHCFYTKKSTLVHGTEQEDAEPCFGQQQIHDKISSLGFQDAKVFVSNVDSQSSASGGIIIQVLGEMSNKGGPWRKFAQTFFLAEQPNGYYVLNDIFRYLKEDDEIEEEAEAVDQAIQDEIEEADKNGTEVVHQAEANLVGQPDATPSVQPVQSLEAEPAPSAVAAEIEAPPAADSKALPASEEKAEEKAVAPPAEEKKVAEADKEAEKAEEVEEPKQEPVVSEETPAEPAKAAERAVPAETSAPAKEAAAAPSAAPAPAAAAVKEEAAPAKTPEPVAPALPKTWANLAASGANRWGSTVSAEVKGVSSSRPAVTQSTQATRPVKAATGAKETNGTSAAHANLTLAHGQVFVKNVVPEHVTTEALRSAFETQFGALRECQVVASKACAFAEFVSPEAAKKAIVASLPIREGGQGGVQVGKDGWTVIVEEKRKPGDRPAGGARSGGPGGRGGNGGDRGSYTRTNTGRGGAARTHTGARTGGRGGAN